MTVSARLTRIRRLVRRTPPEVVVWIAGLLALAVMDPRGDHLLSLCPLDALGFSFCPGCGLGHAVAYLARGELMASVQAHPLGVPAVLVLLTHTARLVRKARPVNARPSLSNAPCRRRHVERT